MQWNSHGYDVAKIFAKKFDIISPVWLQIVKHGDDYAIAGDHDIDAGWLNDLRRKGKVQQNQRLRTVKGKTDDHMGCHIYLLYLSIFKPF